MKSPLLRKTPLSMVCLWIAAAFLPQSVCFAQTPAVRDVLIEASPQYYWITRIEPDDQPQRVVSTVQMRPIGGAPQWKQIAQVPHRITSISRYATRLVALLENGDWMTVGDGDSAPGVLPEDGSKLLALAGNSTQLWAVASSGAGRTPTTTGTTQPAQSLPSNTLLLYWLDRGRWKFVAPLPGGIGATDKLALFMQNAPVLIVTSDSGLVRSFGWDEATAKWDTLGTIAASAGILPAKLLSGAEHLTLWLSDENGSGELRMRSNDADMQWSQHAALALPATAPKGAASDAVIAGGNTRVVLFTTDGKLLEYSYPLNGSGQPQQVTLPAPTAPAEPKAVELVSAIAVGILTIVLISTARRDEAVSPEVIEAAGLKLAPNGARLLAGVVDAMPLIGTLAIMGARANGADTQQIEEMMQGSPAIYSALAVYVLHTLVSEAFWGWTIGKKLFGLRVATMDGSTPDFRSVFLRNILRVVDVALSFLPALFVLVSPLRQRAGDIAAGTIVIVAEKNPPEAKS